MKKYVCLTLILTAMLSLTSCEVHWFDQSYDVAWYVIAIPVALFSIVMFWIGGTSISRKKYVCPHCRHKFHPSFWVAMVSLHVNSDRYFKCPQCGEKHFCKVDREDD